MSEKPQVTASVRDALSAYNAKRDFAQTAEPSGAPGKAIKPGGNIFMVQKHAATRLHYDFRLELDGVLKSWAVTRGPSLDPNDKRLAVMTEDHPLDYATFEGTIPKGAYGGGTVMLWDRGTWEPEGDPRAGLKKGKLHFTLHGERMKGEWVLFRLKGKPGETRENWLLRKVEDAHAGEAMHLVDTHMTSVSTGRGMAEIAGGGAGRNAPKAKAASKPKKALPLPAFRPVQLCTLADTAPAGDAWLHEVKYDGYRALLAVGGGQARAYTRKANDWTGQFAQIATAAAKIKVGSALIDGEVVALDAHGMPSFSALQNAIKAQKPMVFFAFDLLEIDGTDLTHLPLTERKARLKPMIEAAGAPFVYADHVRGGGEDVLNALCKSGYEGIVSKRADGKYSGRRSPGWLKVKCIKRQEFVIGGWKVSDKRHGFSSLLLGYYEGDRFIYAGRVGTGFNGDSLADIAKRMEALAIPKPAFEKLTADARRGARWVRPELVAEIAFTEMTPDGSLRHPSFLGLRFDKPAKDVVFEQTGHVEDDAPVADTKPKEKGDTRAGIKITNPDRPVFPDVGISKMAVVDYYVAMEKHLMPEFSERPLSLVRCPQGRGKYCFFQKHDSGSFDESVKHVTIVEASSNPEPYLYVDSIRGVVACLQMGTLEFHAWGSHVATVEQPDRLVFDLDPDPSVTFETVKEAAFTIRDRLASIGLETWPMLSGGKGVHVVLPIKPELEWPEIKNFCRTFAQQLANEKPDEFTAALAKVKRTGRIFIDYLRNQRGATAILPYSTRSREGAPVAAPVTWKELPSFETGHHFSVSDLPELLKRAKALEAAGWARSNQSLLAALNGGG